MLSSSVSLVGPEFDRFFWMLFFIAFVAFINYRGVLITGLVQDVLTYSMIAFLLAVSVYTLWIHPVDMAAAVAGPKFSANSVLSAAGVGVFLYVGFEWVTPLAEETTDYRLIGRGMLFAIGLLAVTYSLFTVAMYAGLTREQLAGGTPIPHILFGRNLFGGAGVILFVLMSVLASVTSFNSGLLNTSRFAYAMGRDNVLPRMFTSLHPDHASPQVAILALALFAVAVSVVTFLPGSTCFHPDGGGAGVLHLRGHGPVRNPPSPETT